MIQHALNKSCCNVHMYLQHTYTHVHVYNLFVMFVKDMKIMFNRIKVQKTGTLHNCIHECSTTYTGMCRTYEVGTNLSTIRSCPVVGYSYH